MNKSYDNLNFYNQQAELYCTQTINCDLTDVYQDFLAKIPHGGLILDFGCGSGRDAKIFHDLGYQVELTDGSAALCDYARKYTNLPVKQMLFEELDADEKYDGIWACCSVMHVEKENFPKILRKMSRALKPGGVMYLSFKVGDEFIVREGKYYNLMTKPAILEILQNFPELKLYHHTKTAPRSDRPGQETWGNFYLEKIK